MAKQKKQVFYWRVTVELPKGKRAEDVMLEPGKGLPGDDGDTSSVGCADTFPSRGRLWTVEPVAVDKLQASHRAAVMLGLRWRAVAAYMQVDGPYRAEASRIRQWNTAYPAWSPEREDPAARAVRHFAERR